MNSSLINMSENYKKHSERQLSKYGESFKAIELSPQSQQQRFEVLSAIGDLRNKSILDVGCGFGDFYAYLRKNFQIRNYVGIDISSNMVEIARRKNPSISFYHIDILNFEPKISVDYSLMSCVFFLHDSNWENRFIAICRKLLGFSKIGIGINLLSVFSPNYGMKKENHYAKPWEILKLVMDKLCTKTVLRHDYRINDFTVYMYKGDG